MECFPHNVNNMENELEHIGLRLRTLRTSEGLSVPKFAAKYNINKENLYKWEKGTIPSDPKEYKYLESILETIPEGTYNNKQIPIKKNDLITEANLTTIETGIKLNYVITLLAELQEMVLPEKKATKIVSKLQKLVQSDFESALMRLQS